MKLFFANLILIAAFLNPSTSGARVYSQKEISDYMGRKTEISEVECSEMGAKLGQLIYAGVDGYGQDDGIRLAISPLYIKMVKDLQLGGVILRTGDGQYDTLKSLREATQGLQDASKIPLFIGADYIRYKVDETPTSPKIGAGFGAGPGFLGDFYKSPPECIEKLAFLEGFLHRAVGINQALGPTVEYFENQEIQDHEKFQFQADAVFAQFQELGLLSTMKHFPFEIEHLHNNTKDSPIPKDEVFSMLKYFKSEAPKADFTMSTWIIDSKVAPGIAPFSREWIDILRNEVGFKGLLMTDSLGMPANYDKALIDEVFQRWGKQLAPMTLLFPQPFLGAEAIISGHDMILTTGDNPNTRNIYNITKALSCLKDPRSRLLRTRIRESYDRIVAFKKQREALLRTPPYVTEGMIYQLIDAYPDITLNGRFRDIPAFCKEPQKFEAFKKSIQGF